MNELTGTHGSHWLRTAAFPAYPPLTGDTEADVAVIGGGIAGLSVAWELTRAGRSVVVLEGGRVAGGVTGHTTAKVSALHTLVYDDLRKSRGPDAARAYAQSQMAAVRHIGEVAAELGVDCELEGRAAFTYCEDPGGVEKLRAEAEAAREAGLDASFVTETGLPFPVAGAVRVEGQAQFHPRKYLRALAEDLTARGGRIHERTRVVDLDRGEPCRLTTSSGDSVTARDVVVATHHPVFDRGMLTARLTQHRDLVVAGPLPADRDPDGMYITQEEGKRSVRTAPYGDGRLLIVTGEVFAPGTEPDTEGRYERLERWTRERFPGVEITHRWAAQDNASTDTVPLIGPLHHGDGHVYVVTGFAGWGMAGGVLSGLLLGSLVAGRPVEREWAELYDPRRPGAVARTAPAVAKAQWDVGKHFVKDRLDSLGAGARRTVDDVRPGTGEVLRVEGRPCAVYREEGGSLHSVSAVCTHMGCLVAFNPAERTWECPCHGSRFGVDGDVLQGPALHPLERREPKEDRG